jgi:hypothetical protein
MSFILLTDERKSKPTFLKLLKRLIVIHRYNNFISQILGATSIRAKKSPMNC